MTNDRAAIREEAASRAQELLDDAQGNPTIAMAILALTLEAVLQTVPNGDERHAMRHEFIEALEDAP